MSAKPNTRNWNDVQTAIATAAIVTTLGMWNLFATPAEPVAAQAQEPSPTPPPTEPPVTPEPTSMPYVKVMFTQAPTQITNIVQQPQQTEKKKKKKKKDNDSNGGGGGGGGGSASVTQTQSS